MSHDDEAERLPHITTVGRLAARQDARRRRRLGGPVLPLALAVVEDMVDALDLGTDVVAQSRVS